MKNNFSEENTRYSTKDPYKVALLLSMGATIVERDPTDSNNIIFTLEHERIVDFVNAIHGGNAHLFLQGEEAKEFEKLKSYAEHHKDIMGYIRDMRMNRRGQ